MDPVGALRAAGRAVSVVGAAINLGEVTGYRGRAGVPKAKRLESVFSVEDLPQTGVGRVDRVAARAPALDLHARPHAPLDVGDP